MGRRRLHTHEHDVAEGGEQAPDRAAVGERDATNGNRGGARPNGAGAAPAGGDVAEAPASPTRQRAEEMVDHLADRLGHYAGVIGQKFSWLFARAREEAEDIWAEAQALRRGEHPEGPPPQQQR